MVAADAGFATAQCANFGNWVGWIVAHWLWLFCRAMCSACAPLLQQQTVNRSLDNISIATHCMGSIARAAPLDLCMLPRRHSSTDSVAHCQHLA